MLRLWKNFCKDFRQLYVGSSANVEATNINCSSIPSLSDNEGRNSCIIPNQETFNVTSPTKDEHSLGCEQKSANSNNYRRPYFKWNLPKSIFLEICGLSSAVALGWEYGQFKQKQSRLSCVDYSTSLVKLLTFRALPSINKGVRLPINDVPSNSHVLYTDVLSKNTTIKASEKYVNTTTTPPVPSLSDEISETLAEMLKNLETTNNLGLAEWQNSVGVELINSANKKELSEYDHLINISKTDRFSAYQKEAFNCFLESRRLGSAKGAYNLGICYEQGIGTSQNVEKAFIYYEEAARKNHPAAQYNLGLLLYRRYLNNEKSKESDLSEAFSHLRQAAHHGLEEARSALNILTSELANQEKENITITLPAHAEKKNVGYEVNKHESSVRKAFSEPHIFSCCHNNVKDKSEIINFELKKGSVTFYFGD